MKNKICAWIVSLSCLGLSLESEARILPQQVDTQTFELPWFASSPEDAGQGDRFFHGTGQHTLVWDTAEQYSLLPELVDFDSNHFNVFLIEQFNLEIHAASYAQKSFRQPQDWVLIPAWEINALELQQNHPCVVYGPYRSHSEALTVSAIIRMSLKLNPLFQYDTNSETIRNFLVAVMDIYQNGKSFDHREIRLGNFNFDQQDEDLPNWGNFSLHAQNIPPLTEENKGYEVRVCQKTIQPYANEVTCEHLESCYVKKPHLSPCPYRHSLICPNHCNTDGRPIKCHVVNYPIQSLTIGKIHITESLIIEDE